METCWCGTPASKPPTPQIFPTIYALTGVDLGFLSAKNNVEVLNNPPYYSKTLVSSGNANSKQIFERTMDLTFKPYLAVLDIWLGVALRNGWQVTSIFGDEHCVKRSTHEYDMIDIFSLFTFPAECRHKFITESCAPLRLIFTKEDGTNVGLEDEEMAMIQCQSLFRPQRAFQRKRLMKDAAPFIMPEGEFLVPKWGGTDEHIWALAEEDSLLNYLTPRVMLGEKETIMWEKDSVLVNFARLVSPETTSILLFQAEPVMFKGIQAKISHQLGPEQIVDLQVENSTEIAMKVSYTTPTWFNETVTINLNTLTDWIDTPMIIL